MLVLNGLDRPSYTCSGGVCRATTPQQQALFVQLQRELNRVRPMFGLPADVATDGVIGAGTLAKLMKLATKFVDDHNSSRFDRVFDKYAIDSGTLPTTSMVATDALTLVQALGNNGLTEQHYWAQQDAAATVSPIVNLVKQVVATVASKPQVAVVPVGPTATPGSNALPSPTPHALPKFKGVKVALGVLGALAAGGLVLGLITRRRAA
jgi:lysozyme family protein